MQVSHPGASARLVERWFAAHQRPLPWRARYDPYHVLLSEIMLQQTRMEVVLPYFERFLERFPTLESLAAADDDDVVAAWSGLGYYRRARMLRAAAAEVISRFGGTIPERVDELLSLPGIGRYTAGAVASVAWNRRAPIVDGNVARIVSRLYLIELQPGTPPFDREAWRRAEELVEVCTSPRNLNQGLMEIGALICTPRNPSCLICPLRDRCAARAAGRQEELPRPKVKKEPRSMRVQLYLIRDAAGRVLMRREEGPLMHGMVHLPHGDSSLLPGEPIRADAGELLGSFRHSITTRRIEFAVYAASLTRALADSPGDYLWVDPASLGDHPHPSYVRKALEIAALG